MRQRRLTRPAAADDLSVCLFIHLSVCMVISSLCASVGLCRASSGRERGSADSQSPTAVCVHVSPCLSVCLCLSVRPSPGRASERGHGHGRQQEGGNARIFVHLLVGNDFNSGEIRELGNLSRHHLVHELLVRGRRGTTITGHGTPAHLPAATLPPEPVPGAGRQARGGPREHRLRPHSLRSECSAEHARLAKPIHQPGQPLRDTTSCTREAPSWQPLFPLLARFRRASAGTRRPHRSKRRTGRQPVYERAAE